MSILCIVILLVGYHWGNEVIKVYFVAKFQEAVLAVIAGNEQGGEALRQNAAYRHLQSSYLVPDKDIWAMLLALENSAGPDVAWNSFPIPERDGVWEKRLASILEVAVTQKKQLEQLGEYQKATAHASDTVTKDCEQLLLSTLARFGRASSNYSPNDCLQPIELNFDGGAQGLPRALGFSVGATGEEVLVAMAPTDSALESSTPEMAQDKQRAALKALVQQLSDLRLEQVRTQERKMNLAMEYNKSRAQLTEVAEKVKNTALATLVTRYEETLLTPRGEALYLWLAVRVKGRDYQLPLIKRQALEELWQTHGQ